MAGHVVFPRGYLDNHQVLCRFDKTGKKGLVTVYGNDPAASVSSTSQLPYPYGSVMVMETSSAASDSDGKVVLDETGHYRKDKVLGLHVMGKEHGFGAGYGQDRTGDWDLCGIPTRWELHHATRKVASLRAVSSEGGATQRFRLRGTISF